MCRHCSHGCCVTRAVSAACGMWLRVSCFKKKSLFKKQITLIFWNPIMSEGERWKILLQLLLSDFKATVCCVFVVVHRLHDCSSVWLLQLQRATEQNKGFSVEEWVWCQAGVVDASEPGDAGAALIPRCSFALSDRGCFKEPDKLRLNQTVFPSLETERRAAGAVGPDSPQVLLPAPRKEQTQERREKLRVLCFWKAKFYTVELQRRQVGFQKSKRKKKQKKNAHIWM